MTIHNSHGDKRRALELFSTAGSVLEIRGLDCWDKSEEFSHVRTGYFDREHLVEAEAAITELETKWHASGVYITLNPIRADVRGRAANRLRRAGRGATTKDLEILSRRFLLIDCDPTRPSGVSSTDSELKAAEDLARAIGSWLCAHGFPRPVLAISGNGFHLLFRIDLPCDDNGLVKRCLEALDQRFSTDAVAIDLSVFNPSRITKAYGSITRKGDSIDERPNRPSKLIEVPEDLQVVLLERLEWLAGQSIEPEKPVVQGHSNGHGGFDIDRYLSRTGAEILKDETGRDGARRIYLTCPGIDSHSTENNERDCFIIQRTDGKFGAKCFHASCGISSWATFRDKNGPITSADFPQPDNSDVDLSGVQRGEREGNVDLPGKITPVKPAENRGFKYSSPQRFIPFPLEILPDVVKDFCVCQARSICCDPTLVILPVLAVMASAIGNSRRVVCRSSWAEPSILWTVPVADSGSGKSPAFDAALAPLIKLQKDAFKTYEKEMAEYKSKKHQWEQQKKKPLIQSLEEPQLPQLQDIFLEDSTVEAIGPVLMNRPRGSLMACEELSGWFQRLNAYKQKTGADEAFYLQAHGGRSAKVNRKNGQPLFIPAAVLSITGTIQSYILKQVLSRSHIGSGMGARFLFAMPPEQVRVWSQDETPSHVIDKYHDLIYRLAALPMNLGGDFPEPSFIGMNKPAQSRFIDFYNEIGASRPDIERSEMKAAWSKLEGGAARIALVFSCARFVLGDKQRELVDTIDIMAGITASKWFAHEAERIYSMLGETDQDSETRQLIDFIQSQGGQILPSVLSQKRKRYRGEGIAEGALQTLVNIGAGSWSDTSTRPTGGRPSRTFILSPVGGILETPKTPCVEGGSLPGGPNIWDELPPICTVSEELSAAEAAEIARLFP